MQSAPQEERGTRIATIHPNAHVLAGLPYTPHSSLFDFLRGEPKVLGAVQILLALLITSIGTVFVVHHLLFSGTLPVVFLSAYPLWGPVIFIVTGCLTMKEQNSKTLRQSVTTTNVASAFAATAGIVLTLISCTQQYKFCQKQSVDGPCAIGRTLLLGLLSILLIISIVQFSISVTITCFRSKCWMQSDEVVFFLPTDIIKSREQPAQEENAQLQSDHQKEPYSFDVPPQAKVVFFGGYAFFQLRHSKSFSSLHGSQPNRERALPSPNEEQENISSRFKFSNAKTGLKPLLSTSEARLPQNVHAHQVSTVKQLSEEDLKYAIVHSPKEQARRAWDKDLPLQAFPSPTAEVLSVFPVEALPTKALLMKASPVQGMHSKSPLFRITESSNWISENSSPKDKPPQDKPPQAGPAQDMLEASAFHPVKSPNTEYLLQVPSGFKKQRIEAQSQRSEIIYQDILTEVLELTQEWQSTGGISSDHRGIGRHSPRSSSLGPQVKRRKSARRKSLEQKIRSFLFSKKHTINKKSQYTQTSEQFLDSQVEDRQAKAERSPWQNFRGKESKDQQAKKEQSAKKQAPGQQAEEDKPPKGQARGWRAEGPRTQGEDVPGQPYHDSQSTAKQAPHRSAPDSSSFIQESLKQKGLYPEVQAQNAPAQRDLGWQLQYKQFQEEDQDSQSRMMLTNAAQIGSVQTRDILLAGVDRRDQNPTDTQSEDTEPDDHPSSSQSGVQETYLTCLSNKDSEQEVQQNTSLCSGSTKDDMNMQSPSCSLNGEPQQSEESD
ncbi:membrane-spanning 4-domains subfamily A member 14 isoform X1 [Octodon degus]|uniref:Membrane-spanning 4-domains subfamily A member 14 isoform X1 n=1 Tax=Octodon degus TaxID=10160 RepID=A0A6P6DS59_OCTDE|nr:membrane-spanning 4-domains subfamily A member 14 isoform X1 [Octodon degus]